MPRRARQLAAGPLLPLCAHLRARLRGRGDDAVRVSAGRATRKRGAGQALERAACCASSRVEARVHGDIGARGGNVLVVANHISWLDIFVLNAVHPVRFVAKSELARWPVVGAMIRGAGTLFIERAQRRDTHRVNQHVARRARGGRRRRDLPEGTTTDGTRRAAVQELAAAADRRGGGPRAAGGDPLPRRRRRRCRSRPRTSATRSFAESFWRVCGERALGGRADRAPRAARARRAPARSRARRRRRYPNGFGCTGMPRRHLDTPAGRRAGSR